MNTFMQQLEARRMLSERADYIAFTKYQKATWETLVCFDELVRKYDVPYQLAYGSLLGAIRDKGQIPWDYDIDVFVPYSYREKLVQILEKYLPDKFYYCSVENKSNYASHIIRIAPVEYDLAYLHVDIFFLIGAPANEVERKAYAQEIKKLYMARYDKLLTPIKTGKGHPRTTFKLLLRKIRARKVDLSEEARAFDTLCMKYPIGTTGFCITADRFADWYDFSDSMLETADCEIDGHTFSIPQNYDNVLRMVYGEYQKTPKFEDCVKEFETHFRNIEKYGMRK